MEREAAPGGFQGEGEGGEAQGQGLGRVQQPGKEFRGAPPPPPSHPAPHWCARLPTWATSATVDSRCLLTLGGGKSGWRWRRGWCLPRPPAVSSCGLPSP